MSQKRTTTLAFVPILSLSGRLQSAMVLLKMSLAVLRGKQAYLTITDIYTIGQDESGRYEVAALREKRDQLKDALLATWQDVSFDSDGPGDEWIKGLALKRIGYLRAILGSEDTPD